MWVAVASRSSETVRLTIPDSGLYAHSAFHEKAGISSRAVPGCNERSLPGHQENNVLKALMDQLSMGIATISAEFLVDLLEMTIH